MKYQVGDWISAKWIDGSLRQSIIEKVTPIGYIVRVKRPEDGEMTVGTFWVEFEKALPPNSPNPA